jgi:hypothetical protein
MRRLRRPVPAVLGAGRRLLRYVPAVLGAGCIVAATVALAGPWWGVGAAGLALLVLDSRID